MTEMAKDESISNQIQKKLSKRGVYVHSSTVRGLRKEQRWTLQKSKYCQLICDMNKIKRLELVHRVFDTEETFDNIIFSDKCSFSLQHFRPTCYRYVKVGKPPKRKPKPKHPVKLHVWAGISKHGATKICNFEGVMEADL